MYAQGGEVSCSESVFNVMDSGASELGKLIHGHGVKVGLASDNPLVNALLLAMTLKMRASSIARCRMRMCSMIITLVDVISTSANLGPLRLGDGYMSSQFRRAGRVGSEECRVVSSTSMVGACASSGLGPAALDLFSRMKEEGVSLNSSIFTAILTACRHAGLVEEGRKHFESMMKDYSIITDVE
ncbi:hypothetical protein CDL15_Pgr013320 [Punica granatum]|uniref:Uncharacterized protein n=1 Tax=Punica granatum TaxID=22663 RepID=A0A218WP45_PUNGR|nr:hypothetical protein CDL15_Pgr013320 [Punica granatum]